MPTGYQRTATLLLLLCLGVTRADEPLHDRSLQVSVSPGVLITADKEIGHVVKLGDGSLFIKGFRSSDGGATWQKMPEQVRKTYRDGFWHGQQASCVLEDGSYLGIGMMCEMPDLSSATFKTYRSGDHGRTMTGPVDAPVDHPLSTGGYVETGEFRAGTYVNRILQTSNGNLVASCYGWWRGDETYSMLWKYVPELGMYKYRSWVMGSADRGRSWKNLGSPGYCDELGPEGLCEPGITELANGDLLMLFRNGEGSQPCFQSRSADGGLSWSPPERLRATGCAPQPLLLSNGLLVASHGRPRYYLWVSPDGRGRQWTSQTLIGDGTGYSSIVEDQPGELVFVGHGRTTSGQEGLIAWRVRVHRSGQVKR